MPHCGRTYPEPWCTITAARSYRVLPAPERLVSWGALRTYWDISNAVTGNIMLVSIFWRKQLFQRNLFKWRQRTWKHWNVSLSKLHKHLNSKQFKELVCSKKYFLLLHLVNVGSRNAWLNAVCSYNYYSNTIQFQLALQPLQSLSGNLSGKSKLGKD